MANLADVKDFPNYVPYLNEGFVGLVNHMGSDQTVEFATRMSYGQGTRTISDTRALLRYLVRHLHTSPLEMGEVVFHLKLPIAIMRQLVRHRTASLNEYSARYSELTDEVYVPPADRIAFQSTANKQGSGEAMDPETVEKILAIMESSYLDTDIAYRELLALGLSRETARMIMPVGGYTEVVWKCDLKNFFHMVKLRTDSHAQKEIQVVAQAMYDFVKPLFPILCQAFEDYWRDGATISVFELEAIRTIILRHVGDDEELRTTLLEVAENREQTLSKREIDEFVNRFSTKVE